MKMVSGLPVSTIMLETIWQCFTVKDMGISLCETEIRLLALDSRKAIQTEYQMVLHRLYPNYQLASNSKIGPCYLFLTWIMTSRKQISSIIKA